jgi:hypothetical protein
MVASRVTSSSRSGGLFSPAFLRHFILQLTHIRIYHPNKYIVCVFKAEAFSTAVSPVDFSFVSEYDIRKLNPERKARPNEYQRIFKTSSRYITGEYTGDHS